MGSPDGGSRGRWEWFPDDSRADAFVREFPTAVAPAGRKDLATKPPLVILRVPGSGAAYEDGVHRVVESLRRSLDQGGRLAPYAHLAPAEDSVLLSGKAGTTLRGPEHMAPDRYPHFNVAKNLVTYIREHPGHWPGSCARELRAYAWDRRRAQGRDPRAESPPSGPPAEDLKLWLLGLVWPWFTRTVPRGLWSWWTSRRVMRAWLTELRVGGGTKLFPVVDGMAAVQAVRLQQDPLHEEALQELEQLQVRALLEDLSRPRVGGLVPKRRRRTARPVFLVELPPAGAHGARAAERFLRALHRVRDRARQPGPLVVAVGQPSPALLADLGAPAEKDFMQAGQELRQKDGPPVLVTFGEDAMTRQGLPVHPVKPRTFRLSWRTTTSLLAAGTALVLIGGCVAFSKMVIPDHHCVGGNESNSAFNRARPPVTTPRAWYDAARKAISDENENAERFAAQGRTVRTVVAFSSNRPETETDALFDGTIPELRGVALWQRRLNDEAISDDSRVLLRVDVRTTGRDFRDAESKARELVDQLHGETAPGRKDYEQVVGVLGYAQSRDETRAALKVLADAKVPVVGTTATADEMLDISSPTYWPLAPSNSGQASVEANFASRRNIVERRDAADTCTPAEQAIVIESSADLYSRSLAAKFSEKFHGRELVFNFNQGSDFDHAPAGVPNVSNAGDLATRLCHALRAHPASVVYWSARARDFTAFVNAVDLQGTCIDHDVTVLGGDDLTNLAMTGKFSDKNWLRLYYVVHRMPITDSRASAKTREFVKDYNTFVKATTHSDDTWWEDGYSAVSYDAFHVLSQAIDQAGTVGSDVRRQYVLLSLQNGITFDGATGFVSYERGANGPPRDKALVLIRQQTKKQVVVLACGAYGPALPDGPPSAACEV